MPTSNLDSRVLGASLFILCFLLTLDSSLRGQGREQGSDDLTVVVAKALIDVQSGELVNDPVLYIRDGKIDSVGPGLSIPENARRIDLSDKYLLPGLVDAHTHLCHEYRYELESVRGSNTVAETVLLSEGDRALLGAKYAGEMLLSGYTTVRDLGNSGVSAAAALRDAINRGWVMGPRMYVSNRAISPTGGQFSKMTPEVQDLIISKEYLEINGVDEARQAVRQAIYDGADLIKVIVNSGRLVMDSEELATIVEEADRAGLKVAAHATNGDDPSMLAARAGVTSVEHAYTVSTEVLQVMAENDIYLVPTDAPGVERYQQRIQRALAAGVKIAFGSDMYYYSPDQTRGQIAASTYRAYRDAGMTNLQLLQSATMHPGNLVAGTGQVGLLEKGYFADIIAVDENPLDDISVLEQVTFVMKEGVVVLDNAE